MSDTQNNPSGPEGRSSLPLPVQRFTAKEKACIRHALDHLNANQIADPKGYSGWYSGDRAQFIKRHKKAITVLTNFLASNNKDSHE